jgi:AbrB family looped-hinge helix DNA binding protein
LKIESLNVFEVGGQLVESREVPDRRTFHVQLNRFALPEGVGELAARGRGREPPQVARLFIVGVDAVRVRRYLTLMKTTVSSKGQIVLPAEFRQMDRIEPGQEFEVERLDRGDYRIVRRSARPNDGVLDWLLDCPEKGFFVPVESESTDTL